MAEEPYLSTVLTRHTPLWPAGHLPLKGGDQPNRKLSSISDIAEETIVLKLSISPLEGEMAGRPEGGAEDHRLAGDDYAN